MNLCRACGEDFGSLSAFDAHRVGKHAYTFREGLAMEPPREDGRRCMDVEEIEASGMTRDGRDRWRLPNPVSHPLPDFKQRDSAGGERRTAPQSV